MLLLFGAVLSLARAEETGFPVVTIYSSSEVGVDAQSFSAAQDESGTLFFGGAGLLSFDGERWKHFPLQDGYAISGLRFGPDHRLWAAAIGNLGWFEASAIGEWKFHSLLSEFTPELGEVGSVSRVFPRANEATFVAENQILNWNGSRFQPTRMADPHRLLAVEVNGTIYVHHASSGIYALGAKGPQLLIPARILGEAGLVLMEPRGDDWLLATFKGLFLWRGGKLEPFATEVSDILRRETLIRAARLQDGRYAFSTLRGNIVIMRPEGALDQTLTPADGLPAHSIESLFVDRDGQLWATSRSGIFRVDLTSGTTVFDQRAGLPVQAYDSITKIGNTIVVGSESGAYSLSTQRGAMSSVLLPGLIDYLHAENGVLLAGGFKWAKRLGESRVENIYKAQKDVFVITPSKSQAGELYLSETNGITRLAADGTAREVVRGLPDFARSIVEDEAGNLWMGTISRGVLVAHLSPNSAVDAVRADGANGLPALEGRSFVRAAQDGTLLVFADNGGWIRPAGEQRFRAIENYPQRGVAAVSDFGANGLGWVVHSETSRSAACAARISVRRTHARWEPHSIAGLPVIGLPRSIFVEATDTQAVNLWIGGTKSVLRHVVANGPSAPQPRPPLLRGFARRAEDDTPEAVHGPLPYSTRSIEFELAQPEFLRRASLRLETRIDGIDQNWLPGAPDARRVLMALRDGRYTFRARAVAETGVTSDETVFTFQVQPPWWRTRSALLCEGTAAALMLWGAYAWRVRALRRRNAELESKVRQRTRELEEASAAKTQFVANMSHDIRNPLNGIVGLVLALENTKLDRRQREVVATLHECSTYLSSLVDDVLDFASIEAGRIELKPGPFVPQELLRSVVNTLKAGADATGALLLVEADPELPPSILGDAGRIQQILVNFVSNALKYAGGQIRLSVTSPADSIGEIEFSVTDEGPGISAEEQRTLFTKFTRLKRTQGHDIRGAGLGLAACRLLADLMGGSVGVDSRIGEGARFWLRLPLTIATAPVERATGDLPNTTVLVVEDTDYNAWAAEAVLARLGLTCERARDGAEALAMFGAKRFNVVLLDRNLPDIDGTEVARRMREMETDGSHAVLLAVTAYCTAEDRALCLESGMDAFVGKPLTPEKLRRVLLETGRRLLTTPPAQMAPSPAQRAEPVAPETPEASASSPARQLDWSLFRYLSDGTPEGFELQRRRFLDELAAAETELCAAVRAADDARLRTAVHRLLGHAKTIGDADLEEACLELQTAARTGDHLRCQEELPLVRRELAALRAAMHHRGSAASSA